MRNSSNLRTYNTRITHKIPLVPQLKHLQQIFIHIIKTQIYQRKQFTHPNRATASFQIFNPAPFADRKRKNARYVSHVYKTRALMRGGFGHTAHAPNRLFSNNQFHFIKQSYTRAPIRFQNRKKNHSQQHNGNWTTRRTVTFTITIRMPKN